MIDKNTTRLIVFFVPEDILIGGGVISIFSLCKESRRFSKIHKAEVVLCVYPGQKSYKTNTRFPNDEYIYSLEEIFNISPNIEYLQMHIPEYFSRNLTESLYKYESIRNIKKISINILNQNIEYMPNPEDFMSLYSLTNDITQTTAHKRYCTQDICNKYNLPTHHFSVWIDKKHYKQLDYKSKKKQIAVSMDKNPLRSKIIKNIREKCPNYKIIDIKNLSYEEYKILIRESLYVITFGEGFDGYFIESIFSGTVAFSVYNDVFFPESRYNRLDNVYESYEAMLGEITNDINSMTSTKYKSINDLSSSLLEEIYNEDKYFNNIKMFYKKKYDYIPSTKYSERYLKEVIEYIKKTEEKLLENSKEIQRIGMLLSSIGALTDSQANEIKHLSEQLRGVQNSRGWKMLEFIRRHRRLK